MAGVAEAIGIEPDALREALDAGQSVADVATANGVDPAAVVDALVDHAEERLAEKVAEGDLTQAEADERLAERTERTNDRVFETPGEQPAGQPGDA
jgi:transposase-like protein